MDSIVIPYTPRPLQMELHNNTNRFQCYNVHRRFGKTVFAINKLIKDITQCPLPKARGAYIAPLYKQAKMIAWEYLKEFTRPIPGMRFNESELRADFATGARISLFGGDNPHALRGIYLDSVVLDETAQIIPSLWTSVLRPALADRKGKALFIGTPFGMSNQFYRMYEEAGEHPNEWDRRTIDAVESGYIAEDELEAARRQMSPEEFQQEFMCSWSAAIKGAYFGKEMELAEEELRITTVKYDERYPVITSSDLGAKDGFVVWYWQIVGTQIRAIRCEEFHYAKLKEVVQQMNSHDYIFSQHIYPFDIGVFELGEGTRSKQLKNLGIRISNAPTPKETTRADGINAVRNMIGRTVFDRENCALGIEALKTYRSEYNEVKAVYSNAPLHDWASDYADSARYFAITKHKNEFMHQQQEIDYRQHDQGIF